MSSNQTRWFPEVFHSGKWIGLTICLLEILFENGSWLIMVLDGIIFCEFGLLRHWMKAISPNLLFRLVSVIFETIYCGIKFNKNFWLTFEWPQGKLLKNPHENDINNSVQIPLKLAKLNILLRLERLTYKHCNPMGWLASIYSNLLQSSMSVRAIFR